MRKKSFALIVALLSVCFIFGACSGNKLPEGFVEKDVIASAENIVSLLSAKKYDSVVSKFSAEMAKSLDAKELEIALGEQLDKLGGFKEFKSEATVGKSDSKTGDYAVAVIVCDYENGSATYTISIDSDGKICGLYMK